MFRQLEIWTISICTGTSGCSSTHCVDCLAACRCIKAVQSRELPVLQKSGPRFLHCFGISSEGAASFWRQQLSRRGIFFRKGTRQACTGRFLGSADICNTAFFRFLRLLSQSPSSILLSLLAICNVRDISQITVCWFRTISFRLLISVLLT